jgi:hypothetical protein
MSPIGFVWHLLESVEVEKIHCPAVPPAKSTLDQAFLVIRGEDKTLKPDN